MLFGAHLPIAGHFPNAVATMYTYLADEVRQLSQFAQQVASHFKPSSSG